MSPTPFSLVARPMRAALMVLLLAAPACSSADDGLTNPAPLDFVVARRHWTETAPAAYQYTLRHSCFCAPAATRPVVITVRDGQVESRRYADTGADVPADLASTFPTIDGLFDIIASAIAIDVAQTTVTYDPARGFPLTVALLGSPMIADDENFYGTSDFMVR
jgi:hypothetical protein